MSSSSSPCSSLELYQEYPHARSHSLPSLPNPQYLRLGQHLTKLMMNSIPSSSSMSPPSSLSYINSNLVDLTNLYSSLQDLINSPTTQQSLPNHQHGRLVVENALDASVMFLTTVSTLRDLASRMRDHLGDLQSALRRRRRNGELETCYLLDTYIGFRKSCNKRIAQVVRELDHMMMMMMSKKKNNNSKLTRTTTTSSYFDVSTTVKSPHHHHQLGKLLSKVADSTAVILRCLLYSFSTTSNPTSTSSGKTKRQFQILMRKMGLSLFDESKESSSENNSVINEMGSVDSAVWLCSTTTGNKMSDDDVQGKMRRLESELERIEGCLDGVSRCLVQYRVSFLNMLAN